MRELNRDRYVGPLADTLEDAPKGGLRLVRPEAEIVWRDPAVRDDRGRLDGQECRARQRQVTEMGDSLDSSSKEEIEAAIKDVRENLESDDVELLRQKTDALQSAFHKVSEQMYAAAQQQAAAGNGASSDGEPAASGSADEEEVVDAEVVDGEERS